MSILKKVPVGYNGHQLDGTGLKDERKNGFSSVTVNIDYLIVNLVGTLANNERNDLDNRFEGLHNENLEIKKLNDYGTKVFRGAYTVLWFGEEIGNLFTSPRSEVLPAGFCQFQFRNHLFYVFDLSQLKTFMYELTEITGLRFSGINRLDIAVDTSDSHGFFASVIDGIRSKMFRIAGRTKNFSLHYETHEGHSILNGYSVGKRTSSRYLRVYNKSLEMRQKPKGYIRENWVQNGIDPWDVWRFEYQLNNRFFKDLIEYGYGTEQDFTWSIFDRANLVKLLSMAQKNHFDIRFNTGKSETNKEKEFRLFDWQTILKNINDHKKTCLKRLDRRLDVSQTMVKRAIKSMLRQYYDSKQDLTYLLPVNALLLKYRTESTKTIMIKQFNPYTMRDDDLKLQIKDDSLQTWLEIRLYRYLAEFDKAAIEKYEFDFEKYRTHLNVFI